MQTDAFRRRRGRPPKYPKNEIPVVPKINMSDEDITGALSKMSNASSCSTLLNGFIEFSEGNWIITLITLKICYEFALY